MGEAVDKLSEVFKRNGYPIEFIDSYFVKYNPGDKIKNNKNTETGPNKLSVCVSLPFLGDRYSACMINRIRKKMNAYFPACSLTVLWGVSRCLSTNAKESLPLRLDCDMVYKFICDCSDTYIGQTGQQLSKRIS